MLKLASKKPVFNRNRQVNPVEKPRSYVAATRQFLKLDSTWVDLPWWYGKPSQALAVARLIDAASELEKILPSPDQMYRALKLIEPEEVKVVILGMDPYPTPGNPNGLAFSVNSNIPLPASLKNIFKELETDLGIKNERGLLKVWVRQGVLLLNTSLTVVSGRPGTHSALWGGFAEQVVKQLNKRKKPIAFILWGAHARSFSKYINLKRHFVVESYHPSPLSANNGGKEKFFGSRPFSKVNRFLKMNGIKPIDWKT